jgi:hypothetical protein
VWTWVDLVDVRIVRPGGLSSTYATYVLEVTTATSPPLVTHAERRYRDFVLFDEAVRTIREASCSIAFLMVRRRGTPRRAVSGWRSSMGAE